MLDIKLIRENPDLVKESARKKRIDVDVGALLALDVRVRALKTEVEGVRARKNEASGRIQKLSGDEKTAAIAAMKEAGAREKEAAAELKVAEEELRKLMLLVPNVCGPEVPEGKDESENVPVRHWGEPPKFAFTPLDHVALGERLDVVDIGRGVKLSGARSYVLKGDGALLEMAILAYATEMIVARGFVPMLVPHLVKEEAMVGTAYYPGGEEQAYQAERDGLSLIGTSEVPVTSYHMDEILTEAELPKLYAGISPCYRREAGTYGKDTKGLYRIHQFSKVEQVVVCKADPDESLRFHHLILQNAEDLVKSLGIPYRVVAVCGGDLGRPQVAKYDIECWMPSRGGYGETHSASRFHDFQARRLNLRYRDASGTVRFAHTLNNTLVASPRIFISILECFQREDGCVTIPEPLQKWMGGREAIVPRT
ncbi:MAG: serine--tRNA ligase [Acidobacteriota bacterium]